MHYEVLETLLVEAARRHPVSHPSARVMHQTEGAWLFTESLQTSPSLRERTETTDLIVEITLQPLGSFPS